MQIKVLNRQRKRRVSTEELLGFAHRLGPLVLNVARQEIPEQILLVLVSDQKIATIHKRFMGIPGPTDVITFQHGEIIVSVETAARQAAGYQTSFEQELRLYVAHGLLHLAGFEDHSAKGFREMSKLQNALVDRVGRQERSAPAALASWPIMSQTVQRDKGLRRSLTKSVSTLPAR